MMRRYGWWLLLLALFLAWEGWRSLGPSTDTPASRPGSASPAQTGPAQTGHATLPREALQTLQRIRSDGPFPYRQDGGVFQNRERQLPRQARGWYREYTVDTPGSRDRGARRIVTGGTPPSEYWYTDDHYRSFRRIDATGGPLP